MTDREPRGPSRAPLTASRWWRRRPVWMVLLLVLLVGSYVTWITRPARTPPAASATGGPWVIAHRGGALHAPENTLAAVRHALDQGIHGLEIDVHLASDGIPVLMHDATVDRTTDGTGAVGDHSVAELAALDAGGWFDPGFAGEPVPTLGEVLDLVAGRMEICIEIKGGEEHQQGITDAVFAEVAARGAASWCWIGSFHDSVLARAATLRAEQAPDLRLVKIAIGQVPGLPLAVDTGPRLGRLPLGLPVAAVSINHNLLTGPEADRLRDLDLQVWAWTVNDADAMARALRRGADALITDTPPLARQVLAEREAR